MYYCYFPGLISQFTTFGDGGSPSVQVFDISIVCEAAASQRGEFLYVSVVANYTTTLQTGFIMGQFDLSCSDSAWTTNIFNMRSFTVPTNTTLDTTLRSDCSICGLPSVLGALVEPTTDYDDDRHCLGKKLL